MNIKEIEHMWKVATANPNHDTNWFDSSVVKFANLVAAHEREACAAMFDDRNVWDEEVGERIRARGNT